MELYHTKRGRPKKKEEMIRETWHNNEVAKAAAIANLRECVSQCDRHRNDWFDASSLANYMYVPVEKMHGANHNYNVIGSGIDVWWLRAIVKLWVMLCQNAKAQNKVLVEMVECIPVGVNAEHLYYYYIAHLMDFINEHAQDDTIANVSALFRHCYEHDTKITFVEASNMQDLVMWKSQLCSYSLSAQYVRQTVDKAVTVLSSSIKIEGLALSECRKHAIMMVAGHWVRCMEDAKKEL